MSEKKLLLSDKSYAIAGNKRISDRQLESILYLREEGMQWSAILSKLKLDSVMSVDAMRNIFVRTQSSLKRSLKAAKRDNDLSYSFTRENLTTKDVSRSNKRKVFFVTSAVAGDKVHVQALKSVEKFLEEKSAELVIIPIRAHTKPLQGQPKIYDPILLPYKKSFQTNMIVNENLAVVDLQINPQQKRPLTGLESVSVQVNDTEYKKISLIVGSPKQDMKQLPTANDGSCRLLHATGALTLPNYLQDTRVGKIAESEHIMGGLVIKVEGDMFFVSQVQFAADGSFIHDGRQYFPNKASKQIVASAFILGDLHPDHGNMEALDLMLGKAKQLGAKNLVLHDWIGGSSVTHHNQGKMLTKLLNEANSRSLKEEIDITREVFSHISNRLPDVNVFAVESNHTNHVFRYLDEMRFIRDSANYKLALSMSLAYLEGADPIQKLIDPDSKVNFLTPNDDLYFDGIQCGNHGHRGPNGKRGGLMDFNNVYNKSITGHSHTPGIIGHAWSVGHTSTERHGYNEGLTSWGLVSAVIYPGGHREMVTIIDGRMSKL